MTEPKRIDSDLTLKGPRWTVVGLYERGKYKHDTFVCYVSCPTAKEAKEFAERENAERGDAIEVLAVVAGGGSAWVFA